MTLPTSTVLWERKDKGFHIRVKKGAMKQFLYTLLEERELEHPLLI